MRIWQTSDGFLAELGTDFVLVASTGSVVQWFAATAYSDEDDLWRWSYVVSDGRLYHRTTVERGPVETRRDDELVLDRLVAVDDPQTTARIETALRADREVRGQDQLRTARAGDARVAAIVGARNDDELAGDVARARDALATRVRSYDDPLAARLLATLIAVARARPIAAIATAYARGCRLACFESVVPELAPAPAPASAPASAPALAAELAERARELEQAAEWQEEIDARGTAAAYRRAADAIRHAARLVGANLPPTDL